MYLWVRIGTSNYFRKLVIKNGQPALIAPCPYKDRKGIIENQLNAPILAYPSQK
jgi:hypothetical protein